MVIFLKIYDYIDSFQILQEIFANSIDPDQMAEKRVASDQGLYFLH